MLREVNGVEIEFRSIAEEQAALANDKKCKRAFWDVAPDGETLRCYDTPHSGPLGDVYERADYVIVEPGDCEGCSMFEPRGASFPMEVDDILVEDLEIDRPTSGRTGSTVLVRPCNSRFGGKTYLGILVGEVPVQIGLQYDKDGKELRVYSAWSNPLIVIPSENAVVYGYESWWKVVKPGDDLSEITDEEILSQPYMAAFLKPCADGGAD